MPLLTALILLATAQAPRVQERDFLYSLNKTTKEFRVLGALVNEGTCIQVAAILNEKALSLNSNIVFYCGGQPTST